MSVEGPAVELRDVSKFFEDSEGEAVLALDRVSLRVPAGRSLALIGPSGCGKSTLLRCLIGLVEPDAGQVFVGESEVQPANHDEVRQTVGYVVQGGGLFPHMTVAENVALAARFQGWTAARMDQRTLELLDLVRLPSTMLARHPRELSGGQRQRVSLMRALFMDPGLLLLDEPLGALDPMIRTELQEELVQIFHSLRKTVCLVTHDLAEAVLLGDEIGLMNAGTIVQQGTPRSLFEEPASSFVSRFVSAQSGPADVLARMGESR